MAAAALTLVAAAVVFGTTATRDAHATARARVATLKAAPVSPALRATIAKVAARSGVRGDSIRDVAGIGAVGGGAVVLGLDASGGQVVAFRSATGLTGFKPPTAYREYGPLIVDVFTGGPPTETREVAIAGLVDPGVHSVAIRLANGESLDAALVRASASGYGFFAYATTDPAKFPTSVVASGARGEMLQTRDLEADTAPVCPRAAPNCVNAMTSD